MEFKIATSAEELNEVLKLRYQIYVKEMAVYKDAADHKNEILPHKLDKTNRLIYVTDDSKLVGAASLVVGADNPMEEGLIDIYNIKRFKGVIPNEKMSAVLQMITLPSYRSTKLPFRLMAESCKQLIEAGIEYVFCTCQPHLLSMYHRLGFVSYGAKVYNDPEFGIMVPLILAMGDKEHIIKQRSPLKSILEEGDYDLELLQKVKELMGSQSIKQTSKDEGESAHVLSDIVNSTDVQKALFFENLSEAEIQQVISVGHVIECAEGDKVVIEGQVTKTVFVPLEGNLLVQKESRIVSVIQKGEMIGELSFILNQRRTANVFTGEGGAKVLGLEERTLRKIIDKQGPIATNLLLNMSKSLAIRLAETTALLNQ